MSSSEQLMSHEPRKENDITWMQNMELIFLFCFLFSCVFVYSKHVYVCACMFVREELRVHVEA